MPKLSSWCSNNGCRFSMTTNVQLCPGDRSWSCENPLGGCGGEVGAVMYRLKKRYGDEKAGDGGTKRYNYHRCARS
jgi:hypothetical protein